MTEELCNTMHNFVANSLALFILIATFKYFVLLFEVERLFNKVKNKLITICYHFTVAKFPGVKVFAVHDGHLVINLDIVIVHEFR